MRPWQVVAGGMLVMVLVGCSGGTLVSEPAERSGPHAGSIRDPDVEIFMRVAATEPQIAGVLRAVRRSNQVRRYELVSRDDAYREFKRLFKDQPDLIASTSAETLPASVRVTLVNAAALRRFADSVGELPGVDEVKYLDPSSKLSQVLQEFCRKYPPTSARVDAEVFMKVGATPDQVDAVRRRLRGSDAVKWFTYLTKADAVREFKRLFADQADLVDGAAIGVALPSSFRVQLEEQRTRRNLAREVGELPGVDAVSRAGQLDGLCR